MSFQRCFAISRWRVTVTGTVTLLFIWVPLLVAVGLFANRLEARAATAQGDPRCPEFSSWDQTLVRLRTATTITESTDAMKAERKERVESARAIYQKYLVGGLELSRIEGCLTRRERAEAFLNSLQTVFYEETIKRLRLARSSAIRWFIGLLDSRYGEGTIPLFRVTGHFREESPTTYVAGFHRGTGSIYMDLDRIEANDWTLLLIHELLHSLDPMLSQAIQEFSKVSDVKRWVELARRLPDEKQWSERDREGLYRWIRAGLGRGLWAEYRAWYPTLVIYRQGLDEGLWKKISWIEALSFEYAAPKDYATALYALIDDHSDNPTLGIFSNPFFSNVLNEVRRSARANPGSVELGTLGAVPGAAGSTPYSPK